MGEKKGRREAMRRVQKRLVESGVSGRQAGEMARREMIKHDREKQK